MAASGGGCRGAGEISPAVAGRSADKSTRLNYFMMLVHPAARPTVQKLNVLQRSLFCSCAGEGTLYLLKYLMSLPITDWYATCALSIRLRTDPRAGKDESAKINNSKVRKYGQDDESRHFR